MGRPFGNVPFALQDRYAITLPPPATPSADAYISSKFNATTAHLEKAAGPDTQTADQLFITFASAAFLQDPTEGFYMYPRVSLPAIQLTLLTE